MSAHGVGRTALAAVAALVALPTLVLVGTGAQAATVEPGHSDHRKPSKDAKHDDKRKHDGKDKHDGKGKHERSKRAGDEVEPGKLQGGTILKTGWWAKTNEPPPETGLLAPPSVPALIAPKNTLPVARVAGEPERITAMEFALDGKAEGTVKTLKLALRESTDPTSNPNAASATVTACPITETFWVGVENGPWATRPAYDCSLGAVAGKRDDKGVWHFDLTQLAFDWLASDRLYAPAVMLVGVPAVEAGAAPDPAATGSSSFQVAFDAAKGIGLLAKTKAPVDASDDSGSGAGTDDTASDGGSSGGSLGGPVGSGDSLAGTGSLGGDVPVDDGAVAAPEPAPAGDPTAADGEASPAVTAMSAPTAMPWHAGLGPRALLVLPALVLAYLLMLAMGPGGQPVAGQGRRGVSRALDRLRPATSTTRNLS